MTSTRVADEPSRPDEAQSAYDALQALRMRVLRGTLAVLAVAVPMVSLVLILQEVGQGPLDETTIGLSAYTLVFPSLWLCADRLGFRSTAMLLLGLMCVAALSITTNGGVAAGNITLSVLVILLGGFFFGRPGAAVGLVSVVVLLVVGGLTFVTGAGLTVAGRGAFDQLAAGFWVRQAVVLGLLGLAVAVMQVYVVERLADEARVVRRIADREQQQRLALERADREREHEREQRKLAQQALDQSRRMEALARLAGGVAHDFNNALTVIVGNAEYARSTRLSPEELRHAIDEIVRAAHGAGALTRGLLTLGRGPVTAANPVALGVVLDRLRGTLRSLLPEDVALEVKPPPAHAHVRVDPSQLERALFNLVLNARVAMPSGGRLGIVFGFEQFAEGGRLPPGRYVTIAVSDDGTGIDAETLERIFEPFFTTKGEGTGLGLATVYSFARQAGGDVEVRSTSGQGSTFTMILPALSRDAVPAPVAAAAGRSSAPPADARVLVVEDREDVRHNIVRVLTQAGYRIGEAADGASALRALSASPETDLMCIDGVMPGMDTAAVIERALAMVPSLRVLVCSAYVQEDLLRRGLETGRYPFLAKPFTTQALLDAVQHALGEAPPARVAP
jgi:signal transduction histidine kinase/ActR/RegA family two-component response regulator